MIYYINNDGNYLGGSDGEPLGDGIEISPPPEYADQVWQFPGWSESLAAAMSRELAWRDIEMPKAQQNVTALTYGADDLPGTVDSWQKYWLALRKWTADNPDFPNSSKRPIQPT
ncbi:hypothetical protein [Pseudomonas sp. G166]|uniref:hypothetical protein n=1 Tax=Pseudomonas sp. G166 TaxID=3094846 RepID=UPI00300AE336